MRHNDVVQMDGSCRLQETLHGLGRGMPHVPAHTERDYRCALEYTRMRGPEKGLNRNRWRKKPDLIGQDHQIKVILRVKRQGTNSVDGADKAFRKDAEETLDAAPGVWIRDDRLDSFAADLDIGTFERANKSIGDFGNVSRLRILDNKDPLHGATR